MFNDVFFIALFVIAGTALVPVFEKLSIPWPVALILSGFVGSELVTAYGIDLGLRWQSIRSLFLDILIPILVYNAVLKVKISDLRQFSLVIFLLSFPFTIIVAILTGLILFYSINNPVGFPLISAISAGALLSITNPIATINLFSSAAKRLRIIIVGESLFNSIVAISFFSFCIEYSMNMEQLPIAKSISLFSIQLLGACLVGFLSGGLVFLYSKFSNKVYDHLIVSLILCLLTAYFCKAVLGGAGITAVFISALCFTYFQEKTDASGEKLSVESDLEWGQVGYISAVIIFTLMGVSITTEMFTERWLAMLIGIVSIMGARYILIYTLGRLWLEKTQLNLIALGGVRGMAVVALAISLPTSLPGWWTIQSIAYGVVLFSIIIQSPLLAYKLK